MSGSNTEMKKVEKNPKNNAKFIEKIETSSRRK